MFFLPFTNLITYCKACCCFHTISHSLILFDSSANWEKKNKKQRKSANSDNSKSIKCSYFFELTTVVSYISVAQPIVAALVTNNYRVINHWLFLLFLFMSLSPSTLQNKISPPHNTTKSPSRGWLGTTWCNLVQGRATEMFCNPWQQIFFFF